MRDSNGVLNKLWKVENEKLSQFIQKKFSSKNLYIIDGHHRFATALKYQKERRDPILHPSPRVAKGEGSSDFILSVITNMSDPALVIYPIYRALPRGAHLDKESYLKNLEKFFTIYKRKKFKPLLRNHWGIFFHKDPYFYELVCKNRRALGAQMKEAKGVTELDVAILQNVIIPKALIAQVHYIKGGGQALKLALQDLEREKYKVLWLTTAPTVWQVKRVADHRAIMPPKSTFFYPKLLSGPLIRRLED